MSAHSQRIFLVRHGETEFNRLGVFRGRYEVGLNDRGRKQAGEIGDALKEEGIEFLLTSPLGRAVETAGIIAETLNVEHRIDEAFNNICLGEWQGVKKEKVQRDYPDKWRIWQTEPEHLLVPGGESVEQVKERAHAGLLNLVAAEKSTFGIVTHRSVIKVLGAAILGMQAPYFWRLYIDNAAYSVFEYGPYGFALLSWNNNKHLSEKVTEVF
jgi:broad specificity phosphatase PhoE